MRIFFDFSFYGLKNGKVLVGEVGLSITANVCSYQLLATAGTTFQIYHCTLFLEQIFYGAPNRQLLLGAVMGRSIQP
jgi:hypothetical protein